MSWTPATDAECQQASADPTVETLIHGRARDLGGFSVRRVLPSPLRRSVGPFVFFDEMGPADFLAGQGIDVRPHPHINLATITYLFEGEILHRDSLGSEQAITPGAINWMTAGTGIVHSERSSATARQGPQKLHGLQLWIALPTAHEETEPNFIHHPAASLPATTLEGAQVRVLVGEAFGQTSPVKPYSPMLYLDAHLRADAELAVPHDAYERAVYPIGGSVCVAGQTLEPGTMAVLTPGQPASLRATAGDVRLVVVGGAPLDGQRHIWWNFVSSSTERIEAAKARWKSGAFPKVPGDEHEFIPLPEDP